MRILESHPSDHPKGDHSMRLDLADLRLFLHVVESGSITRGAKAASLALASASERLRSMEADAGLKLLERRPRGVIVTEAGDALAHHARVILRQQALMKAELESYVDGERGTLTLYANTAALTWFLPPRVGVWLHDRPQLSLEFKERTSEEIVARIASGSGEAGVISNAVNASAGLIVQPIASDHLVLIVPHKHKLASRKEISYSEIGGEYFVSLTHGNALQDHIDAHARAAGMALVPRSRMKTFDGICEMVQAGVGVGVLPLAVVENSCARYRIRSIPLTDYWARRELCACYADWQSLSPSMRSLLSHLGAGPAQGT